MLSCACAADIDTSMAAIEAARIIAIMLITI